MRRILAAIAGGVVGAGVGYCAYEISFRAMLQFDAVDSRDLDRWGRLAGAVLGFGFGAGGAWFCHRFRRPGDWLAAVSLFLLAFGIAVGQHYWRGQAWSLTWAKALQVPAALCAAVAGIATGMLIERSRRSRNGDSHR